MMRGADLMCHLDVSFETALYALRRQRSLSRGAYGDRLTVDGVHMCRRCVAPNPGFAVQLRQFDRDPKRRELMDRMRQHPVRAIGSPLVHARMHAPHPTLATNGSPAAAAAARQPGTAACTRAGARG